MFQDFIERGIPAFPLWPIASDGSCGCGNTDCKAAGKHPLASNWQHTPLWSEEQLENMSAAGVFESGYGVSCRGLLVIDVDARNGGLASLERLIEQFAGIAGAGLIVETGSGGGSRHYYFHAPEGVSLLSHVADYPGIDFKSTGYVVGPGSRHASGGMYTVGHGLPSDIDDAPPELIDWLRKPERHRASLDGRAVDVSMRDLADMLERIDPDCSYDQWIRVGMALHHATGGTGFALWDDWSARGEKYDAAKMQAHWHSFGRCGNPVTLGTLVHYAEAAGWQRPAFFGAGELPDDLQFSVESDGDERTDGLPFDIAGIDLTKPPGFVGRVADWIESTSRRPRRHLATGAAIHAVGNIAGLRYTDDRDGVSTNTLVFCVAGARTGKEAIQQGTIEIARVAGLGPATHGKIKSSQEIIRNLVDHQAALYIVDEMAATLQAVLNAQKRGGAAYLETVIAEVMSAYGKNGGRLLVTGDMRREIAKSLKSEVAALKKGIEDGSAGKTAEKRLEAAIEALDGLDMGLRRPFLSLIGFTTNRAFADLVTVEMATNGFMGRALLFVEQDTAPRSKRDFKAPAMPMQIESMVRQIAGGGVYDADAGQRIEFYGGKSVIPTDPRALQMLDAALDWLEDQSIVHKESSGLEALYMGAYELVSKVSLILAIAEGVRTAEHVRWAFALVKADIERKASLTMSNDGARDAREALCHKIKQIIGEEGETFGVIRNRLRTTPVQDIEAALAFLVERGLVRDETEPGHNGRQVRRVSLAC